LSETHIQHLDEFTVTAAALQHMAATRSTSQATIMAFCMEGLRNGTERRKQGEKVVIGAGAAPARREPGRDSMLTHLEFESAVKDALRHSTRIDLLAGNPLLRTRLLADPGRELNNPRALRALLVDTAGTLFVDERDKRILRVLELTYFNPAPKQAAAADRLGLSFSTYRRHLTSGVSRLVEWLWQQEQQAYVANATEAPRVSPAAETVGVVRPALAIAILPFLNISEDKGVECLVDGIVDGLIADLSSLLPGTFVIPRSTVFTYKERRVPIGWISEELGVHYIVEGSVLIDVARVRVNVRLIDAQTNEHLWTEDFDKERRELLQVYSEIVGRLSRSLRVELIRAEATRCSEKPEEWDTVDLVMHARALLDDVERRENAAEAIELLRRALELDPDCVSAMVGIALARIFHVLNPRGIHSV
jgi:TolB-like protein